MSTQVKNRRSPRLSAGPGQLEVALPARGDDLEQDTEWCVVEIDGRWQRVRFHDYTAIFQVPGLYEKVIYEVLQCSSPQTMVRLLTNEVRAAGDDLDDLRVLDLGAGNGMVAAELRDHGVRHVVGVDICPEAKVATDRDRPDVYGSYLVADLTQLTAEEEASLRDEQLNCLVCVAALGFGDIPTEAFAGALRQVADNGWVAFNIKEDFLDQPRDSTGFGAFIRRLCDEGVLAITRRHRYCHRLGVDGQPLHYVALVGRKLKSLD